jgi:hypothetical protein
VGHRVIDDRDQEIGEHELGASDDTTANETGSAVTSA